MFKPIIALITLFLTQLQNSCARNIGSITYILTLKTTSRTQTVTFFGCWQTYVAVY